MARRLARDPIYSGRRFSAETIETCVRWYITYRLSYRARHRVARRLLAAGVDPSLRRRELRQIEAGAVSEAFELPSEWQQTG